MLNEKMLTAINKQINAELYSAYLYLGMAAYFETINLKGFANWMYIQADEERAHAMKFYHFVIERSSEVTFYSIDAPKKDWKSPLDVFEEAYEHEKKVTGLIYNLVTLAVDLKDYPTSSFLQWFVDEQVEEEANADAIVQKLKLIGENVTGLLFLDQELMKRVKTTG